MFCMIHKAELTGKLNSMAHQVVYENDASYFFPRHIRRYYDYSYIRGWSDPKFEIKKPKKFKFTSELREAQITMSNDLFDSMAEVGYMHGIVQARPATGKTVLGIYLAHKLNVITLVVIDNKKIVEQWIDEMLKHTDLDRSDIGIIKGKEFDVEDKVLIVSTPQTLSSKFKKHNKEFYPKFRDIGIGLILWDECHVIANEWGSGTLLFNTPNFLGLSATPWHGKDKEILMYSIFGEVVTSFGEYDFSPKYKMVHYDSGTDEKNGKRINFLWENNFNMARSVYNKVLLGSKAWVDVCISIMKYNMDADPKNRMMVLVFTNAQIDLLYDAAIKVGLEPIKFCAKYKEVNKDKDRLLIATLSYGSKAFDYEQLNRMLLAIPILGKKAMVQSIGRILRDCAGKEDAEVWDIYDTGKGYRGLFTNTIDQKLRIINNEYDEVIVEQGTVQELMK